jgi:hypothetical protein
MSSLIAFSERLTSNKISVLAVNSEVNDTLHAEIVIIKVVKW